MADDNRPGNNGSDKEPSGTNWMKSLLIWAGIVLALVLVVQLVGGGAGQARDAIPYSEFLNKVDDGSIRQVVLEQVLLCLLPIAAALLLLVQLPITGALGESLSWPLFAGAALLGIVVMVLVSVLCALYPAWRASRLSPTEALHYE